MGTAMQGKLRPLTRQPRVDGRRAHAGQQRRLPIGDVQGLLGPQHRHEIRQHRSQQLARRGPQHRPAQHESVLQISPVNRGTTRPDRPRPRRIKRMPQDRPGMIPVPAGQLDQLIQDPPLPGPVAGPVGLGQMLRDSLALTHR